MSESSWSDDEVGPLPPALEEEVGPSVPVSAPKKARSTHISELLSANIPTGELYEFSYMHQEVVTHVLASSETDFLISISARDGIIKFWKKMAEGIEFVKAFACGSPVVGACISSNERELAVVSEDNSLRLFDIETFNLLSMGTLRVSSRVQALCYCSRPESGLSSLLAIAAGSTVTVMDTAAFMEDPKAYKPKKEFKVHESPVTLMKYCSSMDCVVSIDSGACIEIWDPQTLAVPESCSFESKFDTDLFELMKDGTTAIALAVCESHFAIYTGNGMVKIFRTKDCKLVKVLDESLDTLLIAQNDPTQRMVHLDAKDLANRLERETTVEALHPTRDSMVFTREGDALIYSTVTGVKIFHLKTNALLAVLGKVESTERFINLALYQGRPKLKVQELTAGGAPEFLVDPTLICTALDKQRFYLFTKRLPGESRDVFNEQTIEERSAVGGLAKAAPRRNVLGTKATIYTTKGDITIELFGKECRKTVENFTTHARNGYYDSVIFHRVIKGFMIQTGDPKGDGTGGTSIWGTDFEDEIRESIRHDKPYMVSMANTGEPNTNGSQFFITTASAPWLDNKHTIFGRVTAGIDVIQAIECVETDDNDKPKYEDIRVLSIKIN